MKAEEKLIAAYKMVENAALAVEDNLERLNAATNTVAWHPTDGVRLAVGLDDVGVLGGLARLIGIALRGGLIGVIIRAIAPALSGSYF